MSGPPISSAFPNLPCGELFAGSEEHHERVFAWIACRRRLMVRYERRVDIHEGFLQLACCLICFRRLRSGL